MRTFKLRYLFLDPVEGKEFPWETTKETLSIWPEFVLDPVLFEDEIRELKKEIHELQKGFSEPALYNLTDLQDMLRQEEERKDSGKYFYVKNTLSGEVLGYLTPNSLYFSFRSEEAENKMVPELQKIAAQTGLRITRPPIMGNHIYRP